MRRLSKLCFLVGLTVALTTAQAKAETDWDAVGGSGNASFEDRCPPGQWLVDFRGRAGLWVDQIQIVCTAATRVGPVGTANSVVLSPNLSYGPPRGGGGGGATEAGCYGVIRGIWAHMTPGNRQVKYIDLWCLNPTGAVNGGTGRFNTFTDPGADVNGGADQPQQEICPPQDAAVGLRGRYGADVNAISLICVPFDPPNR
jgi:hypothetical protein